jgi:4-aminobutyrate aminotransferase
VADEVQSGAGRTGKWWAIEHTGVEPDIVTMAKGIASGMPLGVCMSRAEIMDWVPGSHASTFGGNPLCLASALATIDVLQREGVGNAARVGEFMMERLRGWKETHPLVGDVRGRGLMVGVELVKDKTTREPINAVRNRVETLAFERGLLILGCGETSIRLCPPLIVSEQEATVALDILEDALTVAEKEFAHANEPAVAAV